MFSAAQLAYVVGIFNRTSLGVAGLEAAQHFGTTPGVISTFVVLQLATYALAQVPVGLLLDRFGSRALLTAGVLLAVLAGVEVFRWRTRPRRIRTTPERQEVDSSRRMATLGFLNTVVGVSGPATMYIAGRLITGLSHHLAVQVVLFAVFLVAVVGPYWVITWAWEKVPGLSRTVERATGWVASQDPRPLLALGLAVAAVVFLVLGGRG